MSEEKFIVKTYSKSELSALYGVSGKTFKKWILPILKKLNAPPNIKHYYPAQVRIIVEFLGEP